MEIRKAQEIDIPRLGSLLLQVCRVHHEGRPDLFRAGGRKYDDEELKNLLQDPDRPILVALDESGVVQGYAFCVFQRHIGEGSFNDMTTLYLDDLCIDESCRGQHLGRELYDAPEGGDGSYSLISLQSGKARNIVPRPFGSQ